MKEYILIKMSVQELKDLVSECVSEAMNEHFKSEPQPKDEALLKTDEIAKYLGVSKVTIHTWKREGKIPFHRLGRRIYFKKSEILKGY